MDVAVTGATGFLGSHVTLALRNAGFAPRGVVRRPDAPDAAVLGDVPLARADLLDADALAEAFSGCAAVVANAALGSYQGDLDAFVRTNVTGTENTLRAAARVGARRVVLVSSTAVYRTSLGRPIAEDHERYGTKKRWFSWMHLSTDWRYAVSKGVAEAAALELAEELGLALTILRPGPIYGSRDRKWTARLLRAVARPFVLAPTVGVPAVHAQDVAGAVAAALRSPGSVGRAYTIAGPPVPLAELYTALVRAGAGRARIVRIAVPIAVRYDTTAAARDLGFAARSLEAGMTEVVAGSGGFGARSEGA